MIESTFALLIFVLLLLFFMFFYKVYNTKNNQIIEGTALLRAAQINASEECYSTIDINLDKRVGLGSNISTNIGMNGYDLPMTLQGYAGPCKDAGRSRWHNPVSYPRRVRSP